MAGSPENPSLTAWNSVYILLLKMWEFTPDSCEAHPCRAGRTTRRAFLATATASGLLCAAPAASRIGTFRSDVTPEPGEPLIWTKPAIQVDSPLWAKGVVLDSGGSRYVLCAVDWCAICNATHALFRNTIAKAAGTRADRVLVQAVHQHTAPYVDGSAYALLERLPKPPLRMSEAFLGRAMERLSRAVRDAAEQMSPFDQIGCGEAPVERVASARRVRMPDGKLATRFSGSGNNPTMAALPEGSIDPMIKTIAFAAKGKTLARLYYYATHPQTFCCDGHVSGDFVSDAREALEKQEGIHQIYFTGCAGDVTVGKYNAGSASRNGLAQRMEWGMRAAIAATRFQPASAISSRSANAVLPRPASLPATNVRDLAQMAAVGPAEGDNVYKAALRLAFANRREPLVATALKLGNIRILHLPGEPMLAFQEYAQRLRPRDFVAVAGYTDLGPGYLCTDRAWSEGGYEPSASNSGPGTEMVLKEAIQKVLTD